MPNFRITSYNVCYTKLLRLKIKKSQILLIDGKAEESLELANFAEAVEDTNSDVYLVKGSALIMLGEVSEAIEAYEKAIEFNYDENDDLMYNIGVTLGQAGENEKALEFLERAYENNPKNELVLYELGYYYDRIQEFVKSRNNFV